VSLPHRRPCTHTVELSTTTQMSLKIMTHFVKELHNKRYNGDNTKMQPQQQKRKQFLQDGGSRCINIPLTKWKYTASSHNHRSDSVLTTYHHVTDMPITTNINCISSFIGVWTSKWSFCPGLRHCIKLGICFIWWRKSTGLFLRQQLPVVNISE